MQKSTTDGHRCTQIEAGVTIDIFQQRTEDEAEWRKPGGPYRDAEIGKAEVGNGRVDCTQRSIEPGRIVQMPDCDAWRLRVA